MLFFLMCDSSSVQEPFCLILEQGHTARARVVAQKAMFALSFPQARSNDASGMGPLTLAVTQPVACTKHSVNSDTGWVLDTLCGINDSKPFNAGSDLTLACWEKNSVLGGAQWYWVWRKVSRSGGSPLVVAVHMYLCWQPVQQEAHQGRHTGPKPYKTIKTQRNLLFQNYPVPAAKLSKHIRRASRCRILGEAIDRIVLTQGPYILIYCDTFQDGTSHRSWYKAIQGLLKSSRCCCCSPRVLSVPRGVIRPHHILKQSQTRPGRQMTRSGSHSLFAFRLCCTRQAFT
jgi:hypothetical protein